MLYKSVCKVEVMDTYDNVSTIQAGELVTIDLICENENVWLQPLTTDRKLQYCIKASAFSIAFKCINNNGGVIMPKKIMMTNMQAMEFVWNHRDVFMIIRINDNEPRLASAVKFEHDIDMYTYSFDKGATWKKFYYGVDDGVDKE